MSLPPGQHRTEHFVRFGTALHEPPPEVPGDHAIEVLGAGMDPVRVPLARLGELERRTVDADFHCVAGWSATGLRWEGVPFEAFLREVGPTGVEVTHIVAKGLDGHRSEARVEDLVAGGALIADRLNGAPLDADHGAPARLLSPAQYGYVSTKHLKRIELHTSRPRKVQSSIAMHVLRPHPRARVWEEERHELVPGRVLRLPYRLLIPPFRKLSAYGSRRASK